MDQLACQRAKNKNAARPCAAKKTLSSELPQKISKNHLPSGLFLGVLST